MVHHLKERMMPASFAEFDLLRSKRVNVHKYRVTYARFHIKYVQSTSPKYKTFVVGILFMNELKPDRQ